MKTKGKLYFAYGSNMNRDQMAKRCPDAQMMDIVRLEDYCLAFRMNGGGHGLATILPEPGSFVDGVLWRVSKWDEQNLDRYEGFPRLYRKETVAVVDPDGLKREVLAYIMNSPYRDTPASPSPMYLSAVFQGYQQNGIEPECLLKAVWQAADAQSHQAEHRKRRRQKGDGAR